MSSAIPNRPSENCALRALTLCDTMLVEQPDRQLTYCPCSMAELCYEAGWTGAARSHVAERDKLIEQTRL